MAWVQYHGVKCTKHRHISMTIPMSHSMQSVRFSRWYLLPKNCQPNCLDCSPSGANPRSEEGRLRVLVDALRGMSNCGHDVLHGRSARWYWMGWARSMCTPKSLVHRNRRAPWSNWFGRHCKTDVAWFPVPFLLLIEGVRTQAKEGLPKRPQGASNGSRACSIPL